MIILRTARDLHQVLALGIQLVVLLPQLINLGGEIVDSRQAFAQKQFEAADSALTVFKLVAQAANFCLQAVDLTSQLDIESGASMKPGHVGGHTST